MQNDREGSKLKEVKEYPTDGTNFVAVWEFNGSVWGGTFRVDITTGDLEMYDAFEDCFSSGPVSAEGMRLSLYTLEATYYAIESNPYQEYTPGEEW